VIHTHHVTQTPIQQSQALTARVLATRGVGTKLIITDDSGSNALADKLIHRDRFVRVPDERCKPIQVDSVQAESVLDLVPHSLWHA
jgi:hypothetical protein